MEAEKIFNNRHPVKTVHFTTERYVLIEFQISGGGSGKSKRLIAKTISNLSKSTGTRILNQRIRTYKLAVIRNIWEKRVKMFINHIFMEEILLGMNASFI